MKTFYLGYGVHLQFGKILFITRINKHAVNTICCCGAAAESEKKKIKSKRATLSLLKHLCFQSIWKDISPLV